MKKTTETITRTIYEAKCRYCGRMIKGTTEKSANWNLEHHIRAAHAEVKK